MIKKTRHSKVKPQKGSQQLPLCWMIFHVSPVALELFQGNKTPLVFPAHSISLRRSKLRLRVSGSPELIAFQP